MKYTFEELKKQVITLDFSKKTFIENLNMNDFISLVEEKMTNLTNELELEILSLNNSEIKNVDDLFGKIINLHSQSKIPLLLSTRNLLERIKNDLTNNTI